MADKLPSTGKQREAPAPMHLDPSAIPYVVYGALTCGLVGYAILLGCFVAGLVKDAGPLAIFGLHTVGVFGLLFVYFGSKLNVTPMSAKVG